MMACHLYMMEMEPWRMWEWVILGFKSMEQSCKRRLMMVTIVLLAITTGPSLGSPAVHNPEHVITSLYKTQNHYFDNTDKPEFTNPDWMADILDEKSITEISLPGTHDTMALYGGIVVQCQSWTLQLHLEAGVRFLDIRARHYYNELPIHHGVCYQHATFHDVVNVTMAFLENHPKEVLLMRLKEEYKPKGNTETMYQTVVRYLKEFGDWNRVWKNHYIPSIGEARGKLVILQDFDGELLGIRYGADNMSISDDYKIPTISKISLKWDGVKKHFKDAIVGDKKNMYLTYTSGVGVLAFPKQVAEHMNFKLFHFLNHRSTQRQRLGTIIMDFPAAWLIKMIIDLN
uniref:Phosphatidylinositol-specific phospholipase C X domain-containing protein n=1 Tax=Eptatretus burgeri TaxID=7764 RepID=A0A8C4QJ93_EPTBU